MLACIYEHVGAQTHKRHRRHLAPRELLQPRYLVPGQQTQKYRQVRTNLTVVRGGTEGSVDEQTHMAIMAERAATLGLEHGHYIWKVGLTPTPTLTEPNQYLDKQMQNKRTGNCHMNKINPKMPTSTQTNQASLGARSK